MEQNIPTPSPDFNLPPPQPDGMGTTYHERGSGASEIKTQTTSGAGASGNPLMKAPPVNQQPAPTVSPVNTDDYSNLAASTASITAEDKDLIEKEWVEKAKQIVQNVKDDPYRQSLSINRLKAEYIKRRYNKDMAVETL